MTTRAQENLAGARVVRAMAVAPLRLAFHIGAQVGGRARVLQHAVQNRQVGRHVAGRGNARLHGLHGDREVPGGGRHAPNEAPRDPLDHHLDVAVGELQGLDDDGHHPHLVDVPGLGLVHLRVLLGREEDLFLGRGERLFERRDGGGAAHHEGGHHARKDHHVAERDQRQKNAGRRGGVDGGGEGRELREARHRRREFPREGGEMKAVLLRRHGGNDVLEVGLLPDPVPGPGEVLVRVYAAGINPPDWHLPEGLKVMPAEMRPPLAFPLTPGTDSSGVVQTVAADVAEFAVGDEVFGMLRPSSRRVS